MKTLLYHAMLMGGPSGLSFTLGPSTVFVPSEDETLYFVDAAQLVISAPVPEAMAAFLQEVVIEPRLARLGQTA